jgi:hypothetical protein
LVEEVEKRRGCRRLESEMTGFEGSHDRRPAWLITSSPIQVEKRRKAKEPVTESQRSDPVTTNPYL